MARVAIPTERLRRLNDRPERSAGDFVLYWIQMYHRAERNFALSAAIDAANRLGVPVVAHQELAHDLPHANDRIHRFLLEGVAELSKRFASRGVRYHFHLRQADGDPRDLVVRLARRAALVVTDDFPAFVVPMESRRIAEQVDVAVLAVDSNGIVPLAAIPGEQYGAYTLRPRLRRLLPDHLRPIPEPRPRRDSLGVRLDLPETRANPSTLDALIADCAIDHSVLPSRVYLGGYAQARARLDRFIAGPLRQYAKARNQPGEDRTSRLSAYLHTGQIAVHEVALAVREATGIPAEDRDAYLEELIVRRELAYNFCRFNPHHRSLAGLPAWARQTLASHENDPRPYVYSPDEFERARTHDYLWNAIQTELLTTGAMFGYYRMYWGKKIIEWSRTPAEAQATMIRLHEKYALDGRDPNTYSNILWCLGKHDRPWIERPVFGTVRYMSLGGMEAKTDVAAYVDRVNRWCVEAGRPDLGVTAPAKPTRTKRTQKGRREVAPMPRVDWSYHRPG
ncbi:MAG TPA: deoxyribodipyrimidine photo-lyase [Candidatus Methylomirabilis sp.]|nr:deoxyribodipyrimidine photo-lyase [Candidatus Methylomirabilis sp.]